MGQADKNEAAPKLEAKTGIISLEGSHVGKSRKVAANTTWFLLHLIPASWVILHITLSEVLLSWFGNWGNYSTTQGIASVPNHGSMGINTPYRVKYTKL